MLFIRKPIAAASAQLQLLKESQYLQRFIDKREYILKNNAILKHDQLFLSLRLEIKCDIYSWSIYIECIFYLLASAQKVHFGKRLQHISRNYFYLTDIKLANVNSFFIKYFMCVTIEKIN